MRLRTVPVSGHLARLPPVWTNGLAGLVLAGASVLEAATPLLLLALSLLALDGLSSKGPGARRTALVMFGALTAAALLLLLAAGLLFSGNTGPWPALGGATLAIVILLEHVWPGPNALRPLVAALRRPLTYLTAGLVVTTALPASLLLGAAAAFSFALGLGYLTTRAPLERVENSWPLAFLALPVVYGGIVGFGTLTGVVIWLLLLLALGAALRFLHRGRPGDLARAMSSLIATMPVVDALLIAGTGEAWVAWLVLLGWPLTLVLQRWGRST